MPSLLARECYQTILPSDFTSPIPQECSFNVWVLLLTVLLDTRPGQEGKPQRAAVGGVWALARGESEPVFQMQAQQWPLWDDF